MQVLTNGSITTISPVHARGKNYSLSVPYISTECFNHSDLSFQSKESPRKWGHCAMSKNHRIVPHEKSFRRESHYFSMKSHGCQETNAIYEANVTVCDCFVHLWNITCKYTKLSLWCGDVLPSQNFHSVHFFLHKFCILAPQINAYYI